MAKESKPPFLISQSAIKDFFDSEGCHILWQYQYLYGNRTEPTELQLKGQYFEYQLIGATRHGTEPVLPKLKNGDKGTDEKAIDTLVLQARELMGLMGIEILETQSEVKTDQEVIHPDIVAMYDGEKCLIDIKYTETREDDRWHGWGDPQARDNTQGIFYPFVWHKAYQELLPFYFLVFGKSGWVKFIEIRLGIEDLARFRYSFQSQCNIIYEEVERGLRANPSYSKCRKCPLSGSCLHKATIPEKETISV